MKCAEVLLRVSAVLTAILLPQMASAQGAGKALNFDGGHDYVTIGPVTSGQTLTYEFWVKAVEFKDKATVLWDDDQDSGHDSWIEITSEGKVQTKGDFQEITSSISLQLNTWYHVAFVADGADGTKLYINGIQRASQSEPIGTRTDQSYVSLGMGYDGNSLITWNCAYFKGEIDEVRIWNVALTEAQIREMMCKRISSGNLPSGLAWSDLLGYWRLDEGSGSTASDQTTNHDGTLHGPSWTDSGAALGDESAYDYSGSSPSDFSAAISHSDGDQLTATGDGGTVEGIQVYRVDATSMRSGATKPDGWTLDSKRYWGVFITGTSPTYTVTYNYEGRSDISDESSLGLAYRRNQGDDHWKDAGATLDVSANTLTKTGQVGTEYALGNPAASIEYASGKALDFDGVDDYVDIGTGTDFESGNITVEVWAKSDATDGWHHLVTKRSCCQDSTDFQWSLQTDDNNDTYSFGVNVGGHLYWGISDEKVSTHWTHLAGTYDGETVKIYVNGVLKGQDTSPSGDIRSIPSLEVLIGARVGNDFSGIEHPFDGKLDEVRIWDVALDQATIRDWMCRKVTSSHPQWSHLKGYWRFDESSGTSCDDYSQNSNIGTMINMDPATDRGCSGAAIGDASTHTYTTTWTGVSVNLAHSDGDDITVSSVAGSPDGVQIYRVDEAPNVTTPPSGWDKLDPLRYWGVFVIGGSSPTYTVTYNYDGHPGIADESALRLARRSDGSATSWEDAGATLDTDANTLTKSGESGTEYILGTTSSDNSLPVEVISFTAEVSDGKVILRWVVGSRVDGEGFNVYRSLSEEGGYERLTSELVVVSDEYEYTFTDLDVGVGQRYWYRLEEVSSDGEVEVYGPVSVVVRSLPSEFRLSQNFPNPFNSSTEIRYEVPEVSHVLLEVYDVLGRRVGVLVDGVEEAGYGKVVWDAGGMASGIYFVRMEAGGFVEVRKAILLR